jgi:hypothetical protein
MRYTKESVDRTIVLNFTHCTQTYTTLQLNLHSATIKPRILYFASTAVCEYLQYYFYKS